MSLTFIIGNSVKKNRSALLSMMNGTCAENGTGKERSRVFFFVPEQANLEAEQELTAMRGGGCVMDVDIVSFRRLLHHLLDELGDRIPTVLDDIGKSLVLRRVLAEHAGELPRFGSKAGKPGFIEEVKSLLSEFVRYEVTADVLEDVSERTEDTLLSDKLREFSIVYRQFREKCGETQITEDDIYNAMCPLVRESERMKGSVLFFDGYTGFTPTQYNLVGELMKICRDVVITVTMDPEELEPSKGKTECFRMSRETMAMMRQMAEESGHTVSETIVSERDTECVPELAYLSGSIFRRGKLPYAGERTDAIRLASAPDREAEVRYVAGEIVKLVRGYCDEAEEGAVSGSDGTEVLCRNENPEGTGNDTGNGAQYRDIGIICGDVEGYSELFRRAFSEAGIPFFLDRTTEITDNCLVDYIRSLLGMVYTDMRPDVCMRWLKNPINKYDTDQLNYLENFLIARGIRGLSVWKRGLQGDYGGKRVTKAAESIALAEEIAKMIMPFAEVMGSASTGVREKTEALYRFLVQRNVFKTMQELSDSICDEPVPWSLRRAAECRAIYKAVTELFDRLYTLLPEEKITLRDYTELLEAGFAEMKLGVIPPEPDCVMIGDCKRSRIPTVRYLFFIGLNEGYVPGSGHGSELLNSKERELLKSEFSLTLADTEKEAVDGEEFNILHVLQKPTERLILTWSMTDGEGKKLSESYVVRRIQRLFPYLTVTGTETRRKTFFDRIAVDGGLEELLGRYREAVGAATEGTGHPAAGSAPGVVGNPTADGTDEAAAKRETEDKAALHTLYDWYCSDDSDVADADDPAVTGADDPSLRASNSEQKNRLRKLLREGETGVFRNPELSPEVAGELYPEDTEYSVTRLESYAECPFKHFAEYGLTAQTRRTYEPTQLETGSVYHAILDYAGKRAAEIGRSGRTPGAEEMIALIREGADKVRLMPEFECFSEDNRSRFLYDSLVDNLIALAPALSAQLQQGRYNVSLTEKSFSEELGGVRYCGKIDRIDCSEKNGGVYFKILDYKSSGKAFRPSLALDGVDIQLPIYMRVAEKMFAEKGTDTVPAAAMYVPLTVDYKDGEPLVPEQTASVSMYSPNGVMLVENSRGVDSSDRYLERLDVNFGSVEAGTPYSSEVVSVSVQKDGSFGKGSVYSSGDLKRFLDDVEALAADEVKSIRNGNIEIHPYRNGSGSNGIDSCRYCVYKGLCRRENGAAVVYREPAGVNGQADGDAPNNQTEEN